MIRVLLAEDQAMVRGALAALLALEGDIEIVAQVARGDEVVGRRWPPSRMWRCWTSRCPAAMACSAAADLRAAACPRAASLILTTFGRPGYLRRAMESGAVGFLSRMPRRRNSPRRSAARWPASASSIRPWRRRR